MYLNKYWLFLVFFVRVYMLLYNLNLANHRVESSYLYLVRSSMPSSSILQQNNTKIVSKKSHAHLTAGKLWVLLKQKSTGILLFALLRIMQQILNLSLLLKFYFDLFYSYNVYQEKVEGNSQRKMTRKCKFFAHKVKRLNFVSLHSCKEASIKRTQSFPNVQ